MNSEEKEMGVIKETLEAIEDVRCDRCNAKATYIQQPNPFMAEIHNDLTPCNLCENCYSNIADDI